MTNDEPDVLVLTLRYDVEQLETAQALIRAGTPGHKRLALLLLDNLSELLTYRLCKEAAERDQAFSHVMPPRAERGRWEKALQHYSERIKFCRTVLGAVSTLDATILRIAHRYRNISYHSDVHNVAAIRVLASLLFSSVGALLRRAHMNVGVGGLPGEEVSWLAAYGVEPKYIDLGEAAAAVVTRLSAGVAIESLAVIREALRLDLERRANNLLRRAARDFPRATEDDLDLGIRHCEFQRVHAADIDAIWKPLRVLNYKITQGKEDEVDPVEHQRLEAEGAVAVQSLFASFRSKASWRALPRLSEAAKALERCSSLEPLLIRYSEVDLEVARLERFGGEALDALEAAAEFLSDLERGK